MMKTKPARERRRSLPQELRFLRKRFRPLWNEYDATPKSQVEERFRILKEILAVEYAGIQLAEGLESAGEKVGVAWGWGSDDPKGFYAWVAAALMHIHRELVEGAQRAGKIKPKRPRNLLLALDMIETAKDVLERWLRLASKFKKKS